MILAETRYLTDLVKGVKAAMLVSDLEPKDQRSVNNKAMAVRLFAEAGFRTESKVVLAELEAAFEGDAREQVVRTLADRLRRHWRVQGGEAA